METPTKWTIPIDDVDALMRAISLQTTPQGMAGVYSEGVRRLLPSDRFVTLSRRDLAAPWYRIARSSTWDKPPDPWREKDKLPLLRDGLLGELLYAGQPTILDLDNATVPPDDPTFDYFTGMRCLLTLPQYDNGEALNMVVSMWDDPSKFDRNLAGMMHWQANLFGQATLNLVLRQQLAAAYEALDRELQTVGAMQRALLPAELPQIPGARVAAHYETAARAGGDFYDFYPLPNGCWGLCIGDVSGHGTPAAVTMAVTHAIAYSTPGPLEPPSRLLREINAALTRRYTRGEGTFITAFYGVLDPIARTLTYANAGHNLPRLVRDGAVREIAACSGLPLGIADDEAYTDQQITLAPGDTLVLYTDGITETFAPDRAMFGESRFDAVLGACRGEPRALVEGVLAALAEFSAGAAATDDRTLMALRFDDAG